jgi:23S rRNA pseudouridine1911/1915/1917 synthase
MENCVIKIISSEYSGQRLDSVIAKLFPDFSRSKLKSWLDSGAIFINDVPLLKPSKKVNGGEEVKILIKEEKLISAEPQNIQFEVKHKSKDFLIVDKKAGMVVHPGAGNHQNTLLNALLFKFPELEKLPRAGIIHRLDKETSGLMIIARNQNSYKNLSEQISKRLVKRTYQAFAVGNISRSGKIEEPVGRHPRNRQKQAVTEKGKYALTRYSVLKKYGNYTHLEVNLETGRTHQIRVHMSHIGFPLIGDALYGRKKRFAKSTNSDLREVIEKFPRQALHASNLAFKDIDSGNEVSFESSLPKDLLDLKKNLENLS